VCPYYDELWRATALPSAQVEANFNYTVGGDDTVESVRLDKFFGAEPVRDVERARPCECGAPDSWKCWLGTKHDLLLGDARKARSGRGYTVFPADEDVNRDILNIAQKYMPFRFDEKGMPPEPVRDLCSHLFLNVETMADGNYSTVFLPQIAAQYLRRLSTHTSVSDRLLETNNQGQANDE